MHPNDGRVVSNFIIQALQNKPLTIYGDGLNTRSFQYVSDLVDGLHALMNGDYDMPVNLGNPEEFTVGDLAEKIKNITGSESDILYLEKNQEDPSQRKPVIEVARNKIGWEPKVHVDDGLKKAIAYFQSVLNVDGDISPTGPGATKPKGGDAGSI
jgi:UDP-glucuronate decarboxylase